MTRKTKASSFERVLLLLGLLLLMVWAGAWADRIVSSPAALWKFQAREAKSAQSSDTQLYDPASGSVVDLSLWSPKRVQAFKDSLAGNVVTSEIIASLEYAVAVLGIRTVLVLGHASCGAVKAAMKADTVPGQISSLYPHLRPAVERSAGNLDKAIEANARLQAELLRTSSTVIRDAANSGTVKVAAGVYNLATGKVSLS